MATPPPSRPCLACGYDLHDLLEGCVCPECGATERITNNSGRLIDAPPRSLASLATGLRLMGWSLVIYAALRIAAFVMAVLSQSAAAGSYNVRFAVVTSMLAVPAAMNLIGHLRYTTADPWLRRRESRVSARRIVRIVTLGLAPIAMIVPLLAATGVTMFSSAPSPTDLVTLYSAEIVGSALWLAQMSAVLGFARIVARRAGDDSLADHAGRAMWLYPLLMVAPIAFFPCLIAGWVGFVPAFAGWLAAGLVYVAILSDLCDRVDAARQRQRSSAVRLDTRVPAESSRIGEGGSARSPTESR